MLSCSRSSEWSYISPAGCAAALQRAAAFKTVNNWRHCFRGMHQLAPGLRGKGEEGREGGGVGFIVCRCRTEWDFGMEAWSEGESIGQSNRAKIPSPHGWWWSSASVSSFWVRCVTAETVINTSCPLLVHTVGQKASHWLFTQTTTTTTTGRLFLLDYTSWDGNN